jgi:pyruvate dehydrogenase E2 component (dihydrolipoamide acetyltransferase)
MPTDIVMPQMGESIFEGTLTKWLKKPGDKVQRDEPLFEISTDKVDAEIPAPASGVLKEVKVQEGATVQVNTVVGVIDGDGAGAAASSGASAQPAAPEPAKSAGAPSAASTDGPSRGAKAAQPAAPEQDETETESAPAAPAQQSSKVTEITQSEGDRVRSSPLVRKIAKDKNVDLGQVPGTGMGGRITKEDILGFIEKYPAGAPQPVAAGQRAAAPSIPQAAAVPAPLPAPVPGELVPMSKMRSIIAQRMVESKHTSAHVHTVFKVDMTRIVRIRERERSKFEARNGVKLTYMPFIGRAVIAGIKQIPIVNSSVEGDGIRYHKNVNIGIAVALDWGLIVPVVKQAEERSFVGLQRAINDLAERARAKKLQPDEVVGGTFTITNPGIFGPQFGTPIIMQPQVAILGMGGLFKEPRMVTTLSRSARSFA